MLLSDGITRWRTRLFKVLAALLPAYARVESFVLSSSHYNAIAEATAESSFNLDVSMHNVVSRLLTYMRDFVPNGVCVCVWVGGCVCV